MSSSTAAGQNDPRLRPEALLADALAELTVPASEGAGTLDLSDHADPLAALAELEPGSIAVCLALGIFEQAPTIPPLLDAIHRALRPAGLLVAALRNSAALTYRSRGERFGIGAGHPAPLAYRAFEPLLTRGFVVEDVRGFNTSYLAEHDDDYDVEARLSWARAHRHAPADATDIVLAARRDDSHVAASWRIDTVSHDDPRWQWIGEWVTTDLEGEPFARRSERAGSSAQLDFDGSGVTIRLWAYDACGLARVVIDEGEPEYVDLTSSVPGMVRVDVTDLTPGMHRLRIEVTGGHSSHSTGRHVVIHRATTSTLDTSAASR